MGQRVCVQWCMEGDFYSHRDWQLTCLNTCPPVFGGGSHPLYGAFISVWGNLSKSCAFKMSNTLNSLIHFDLYTFFLLYILESKALLILCVKRTHINTKLNKRWHTRHIQSSTLIVHTVQSHSEMDYIDSYSKICSTQYHYRNGNRAVILNAQWLLI